MAKKKIDIDKYAAGLFGRTEQYADKVRQHYATAVNELLKLSAKADISPEEMFSFSDNKKLSEKANTVLRGLYSAVYNEIKNGVQAEWEYANLSCDALIEAIFGKGLNEDNHFARWFSRNQEAMDAFFSRKSAYGGLNLSQKVWKYTGDLKTEMELALSLTLGQGDSASTVSRKVRQYLQEPDKLFRRIKTGTDENGNPKYKLSKAAKEYHPGRGVYRSSYKNAMRLTRTETNMAYRTSEQERWKQLDFVVGYEITTSGNHPQADICDDLTGKYPKDFVFKGWHPQCRCVCKPILATQDEFVAMQKQILNGEEPKLKSENAVDDVPDKFKEWIRNNDTRIEQAQTKPYFIKDNSKYVTSSLNDASGNSVGKDAPHKAIKKSYKTEAEINETFKSINSEFKTDKWFEHGDLDLTATTRSGINGSTNMRGLVRLTPDRLERVKSALAKIGQAQSSTITDLEADAMATFWHEITHNRNKLGNMHLTSGQREYMELANEFVARKTLPEFYQVLGCSKTPHPQFIDNRVSTGYNTMVTNYDFVITRLGLDRDKVIEEVRRSLFSDAYTDQQKGLRQGLINGGIKRLDGKKVKLTELNKLLSVIRDNSRTTVENWLKINGYLADK